MKSSSKSPRSSPILQFFTSKDKLNNTNNNTTNNSTPITSSPSNNIETQSTSSSVSIIRTLSKCFDGGVGQVGEDSAILNEDELEIVNKAKSINVNNVSKKENKNGTLVFSCVCANLCVWQYPAGHISVVQGGCKVIISSQEEMR